MNTVAIIQARMGSSRLPGKVMMDLCGKPILERVMERVRLFDVTSIVIATTWKNEDDAIVDCATRLGVGYSRGSEKDVLERYLHAAREFSADIVVRITADCPLLDPTIANDVILLDKFHDYASNVVRRTYPKGLDVEAFWMDTLERVARLACAPEDREHVTRYILTHQDRFFIRSVFTTLDASSQRWTVDTQRDLEYIRQIFHRVLAP